MRIVVFLLMASATSLSLTNAIRAQQPLVAPKPVTELNLSVKVVDVQGKPIPDATIVIRKYTKSYNETERIVLDGYPFLSTDQDGSFKTPRPLAVHTAYVLEVSRHGYLPNISRWTSPKQKGKITLPDVVLRKLISVKGTIKDRQGKAVVGVKVFQSGDGPRRTEDTTDARGRFEVPGIPEGKAFLFAEKKDYRFTGQLIDTTKGEVHFELVAKDDPNPPVLKTLPTPDRNWTDEYRKQLAWKILKPQIDAFLTVGAKNASEFNSLYQKLAVIDPIFFLRNLNRIEKVNAANPDFDKEYLLISIAQNLAKNDPEEAAAIIRSNLGLGTRVHYFERICQSERFPIELRLQNANEVFLEMWHFRRIHIRIAYCCSIVRTLLDLGEKRIAQSLLLTATRNIQQLNQNDLMSHIFLMNYSGAWARIDSAIGKMYSKRAWTGAAMQYAHDFAESDPDYSELIFENYLNDSDFVNDRYFLNVSLPRTCFQMSRKYPDRAEKLLKNTLKAKIPEEKDQLFRRRRSQLPWFKESKNDMEVLYRVYLKSLVYLAMASQHTKRKPEIARIFLQKGVDNLTSLKWTKKKEGNSYTEFTPARNLAFFLPIVEKVDPAWVAEIFWLTLASRMNPLMQESKDRESRDESLAFLAVILARYNKHVAKMVIEPLMERAYSRSLSGKPWTRPYGNISKAAYYVDPTSMTEWIEILPRTTSDPVNLSAHRSAKYVYVQELLKPLYINSPKSISFYNSAWDVALSFPYYFTSDQLLKDR